MMPIKINIKPISVNSVWQGRRFKNQEYKRYEKALLLLLPPDLKIPKKRKLEIRIEWGLSSKLADIDNFLKPFLDILQKRYSSTFNDRWVYKLVVHKKIVAKGKEYIAFDIDRYDE
jgi:Holliday junction resolvase RusA-like endonuclease